MTLQRSLDGRRQAPELECVPGPRLKYPQLPAHVAYHPPTHLGCLLPPGVGVQRRKMKYSWGHIIGEVPAVPHPTVIPSSKAGLLDFQAEQNSSG